MKTSKVLRRAKTLIDTPEKWGKGGAVYRPGGPCCAALAIAETRAAVGMTIREANGIHRLFRVANGIDSDDPRAIPIWNDAPDRTHAEVMHAFDCAIGLAEREEADAEERR